MKIASQEEAHRYLYSFRSHGDRFGIAGAGFDFGRVMFLASLLGNPQNKIKVIHIAGTSGKGSTCTFLSNYLFAHGKKTGLSLSPHIFDLRERVQINNEIISEKLFLSYLNEFIPFIEQVDTQKFGSLTFFEIMIVLAYYIFWKENVDYAVMETGLGGRLDATNVATAENKIAVIAKIGIDHTGMLGDTIALIATEKSKIIHSHNLVITVDQESEVQKVIEDATKEMRSRLSQAHQGIAYSNIHVVSNMIYFDFLHGDLNLSSLELSLPAQYQVENASLALVALYEISKRDGFQIDDSKIRAVLSQMKTPGRFQEMNLGGKQIIIDGAHNPQKMSAFIHDLKKRYPEKKFDFLIGFKKGKDYEEMLKYIVPLSQDIYVTEFHGDDQARMILPESASIIQNILQDTFSVPNARIFTDPVIALETAQQTHDTILVITGSLYMISVILKELTK